MNVLVLNCSPKVSGATQAIADIVKGALPESACVQEMSLAEAEFSLCIGCKRCYETGDCFRNDGVQALLHRMDAQDTVVMVCPSWWADVPAQFKGFIDRCTPYADTAPENGHFRLHKGIRCMGIALRAGSRAEEAEHILSCIAHYCGHMGMQYEHGLCLTGIDKAKDAEPYTEMIVQTVKAWFAQER